MAPPDVWCTGSNNIVVRKRFLVAQVVQFHFHGRPRTRGFDAEYSQICLMLLALGMREITALQCKQTQLVDLSNSFELTTIQFRRWSCTLSRLYLVVVKSQTQFALV